MWKKNVKHGKRSKKNVTRSKIYKCTLALAHDKIYTTCLHKIKKKLEEFENTHLKLNKIKNW
jgi:hypothetical protein